MNQIDQHIDAEDAILVRALAVIAALAAILVLAGRKRMDAGRPDDQPLARSRTRRAT